MLCLAVFLTRVIFIVSVPAMPLAADVPAQCWAYGTQCRVYGTQCRAYGTQCRTYGTVRSVGPTVHSSIEIMYEHHAQITVTA